MIVIQSKDKNNYLKALHQCDVITGDVPAAGAFAKPNQIEPFVAYIESKIAKILSDYIEAIKNEKGSTINYSWWYNGDKVVIKNDNQQRIVELLSAKSTITVRELSEYLNINKSAVQKHLSALKKKDYIFRKGGTKGVWIVNLENMNEKVVQ